MTQAIKQPYTLVQSLRELANCTHSDFSVAAEAAERIAALEAERADMAALIRRLSRAVQRLEPGNTLHAQAMGYLQRHELNGAILRDEDLPDQDILAALNDLEQAIVRNVSLEAENVRLRAENAEYRVALDGQVIYSKVC